MYEEQLKELGLTDNEARIYLVLLKSGALNPYQIAEKAGLHRGYVYDSLERMQEKGVVSSIFVNNKQHYQAVNPENLVELLKLKLEAIEKIVPDLKKLEIIEKTDTQVALHKGRLVYRTLIKDIIATVKKGETVLLTGIDEEKLSQEIEPIYLKRYFNLIKDKNIKERIILKKGGKRIKHANLTYKELPEEFMGKTAQIIYSNKVAIFVLGTPYYLTLIENKDVAETYRRQFEALWGLAKWKDPTKALKISWISSLTENRGDLID